MWTKSVNFEVLALCVLSLIPWPGPSVFKISCPRDNARLVRKIVQNKWIPILDKYQVKFPLECPFHPMRDIFGPQQAAKQQHRPSQWTCGFCGKSFFEERHLDLHFDNRHKNEINVAEDAVCLADYCAMMRCEVLVAKDSFVDFSGQTVTTDVEVWREVTPTTATRPSATALSEAGPRALARLPHGTKTSGRRGRYQDEAQGRVGVKRCDRNEAPPVEDVDNEDGDVEDVEENSDSNATACDEHLVDSALPAVDGSKQTDDELQRLKADCKPEDLARLKLRCEILVRDCIAGLLVHLSVQDFTEMEEELNHAVCWYLSCDRYWEEGNPDVRPFPWGLLFVMVMVLSLGICLCYYIIWVLFDHDDRSVASTSASATAHSSPSHSAAGRLFTGDSDAMGQRALAIQRDPSLGHEPGAGDMAQSEHYIYVTYPPDLKRRLLESCYNRTTRL